VTAEPDPTSRMTPAGISAGLALAPPATLGNNGPGPRPRRTPRPSQEVPRFF
jgi:hypothetical protein